MLNRYTAQKLYPGFESLPHRQLIPWCLALVLLCAPLDGQPPDLVDRLVASNDSLRQQAIQDARQLDAATRRLVIDRLVAVLPSKGLDSYFASLSLGKLGADAVPPLLAAIRNPDSGVQYRASQALGQIGAPARDGVIGVLRESSASVETRCAAARAAELMQGAAAMAVPALTPMLAAGGPPDLTRCAIAALGGIGSDEAFRALRTELAVPAFQGETLNALARIGAAAREATPDVVPLVSNAAPLVRTIAVRTLGAIGCAWPDAIAALTRALDDADSSTRYQAAAALGQCGGAARSSVAALIRVMRSDGSDLITVEAAAESLGRIGAAARDAVPDLMELWLRPQHSTRTIGVDAIARIGPDGIPHLIHGLADARPAIRSGAAWHLGEFHATAAVPALIAALADRDQTVRAAARQALGKIDTPEAKAALARLPERTPRASRLVTLAQIEADIPPADGDRTPYRLASKLVAAGPNRASLLVTVHESDDRGGLVRVWARAGTGYRLVHTIEGTDSDPGMGSYSVESFQLGGEHFIHVELLMSGTGHIHYDTMLWIAPDSSVHAVPFASPATTYKGLGKGEGVWKGESNDFRDDRATFAFGIWREGDANCCPSAGEVTGRYTLRGSKRYDATARMWSTDYQIVPVDFDRHPSRP